MRLTAPMHAAPPVLALLLIATTAPGPAHADEGFRVRGYVHYDVRRFDEPLPGAPGNFSEVRRVRPIIEYRAAGWSARFMPDLQRETNKALDAYLDFTPEAPWSLRVGRFKTPMSLNRLQSSGALVPMENSVVGAMTPNRDNGVLFAWDVATGWRLEAGAFDGAADDEVKASLDRGGEGLLRAAHNRDVAGGSLRIAVAASGGVREGAPGDARLARYRTPGRATWFRYVSNAFADGHAGRTVVSADYAHGPWYIQAEAGQSRERVRAGATSASLSHRGWAVAGSRVLTGEARSDRGVTPGNWRLPGLDLPVAVELGAHAGRARIDVDAFRLGLADSASSGNEFASRGVVLSLWFPKQWRLTLDLEHGTVQGYGGEYERVERSAMARLAMGF